MTLRFTSVAVVLALVGCAHRKVETQAVAPPAPVQGRQHLKELMSSNVRLFIRDGQQTKRTASGVVIGSELSSKGAVSYVLTHAQALQTGTMRDPNLLVVADQPGFEALEFEAHPVVIEKNSPLALLRVRGIQLKAATLASEQDLEPGEEVIVVGSTYGTSVSLSGGMLSQIEVDPKSRQPRLVKTDALVGYGASGGGVFSRNTGKLLGIVEGYRTAKVGFAVAEQNYSFEVPVPGETFAIPSNTVRTFLKESGMGTLLRSSEPYRAATP